MKTPSILYVEDHPASRRVMHMMLVEMLGYQDLTILEDTENLELRLQTIDKDFDIIFLDINLKPIDGYQVCELLRQQNRYAQTRIIALTAAATPETQRKMLAVGFDGAIQKPLHLDTFPTMLDRIMAGESLWEA